MVYRLSCVSGHYTSFDFIFFFKQKTAYEMRISDWSSDVCSSDLPCPSLRAVSSLPSLRAEGEAIHPSACAGRGLLRRCAPRNDGEVVQHESSSAGLGIIRGVARIATDGTRYRSFGQTSGDRKSVVLGQSVSVRVDLGGRSIIKKKKKKMNNK